jgi:hypothetical protein
VLAAGLDNYINYSGDISNPNILSRNLSFGAVVGGSVYASNYIAPSFTHLVPIPDTALFSGKTLEHRLIEVGLASGSAILINKFAFGVSNKSLLSQVGIILLSDVVSEYIADYAKSKPLAYLS